MITALARNLRLSATPVREALSRLAGEGLVEDRRGMGFFAWRLDAVDLIELYHLQAAYLAGALADFQHRSISLACAGELRTFDAPLCDGDSLTIRWEAAFENIVADARNSALARVHGLLADRLAPARHIEPAVLGDTGGELASLELAVAVSDRAAISQILSDHHYRRVSHAPQMVSAMRAAANEYV